MGEKEKEKVEEEERKGLIIHQLAREAKYDGQMIKEEKGEQAKGLKRREIRKN